MAGPTGAGSLRGLEGEEGLGVRVDQVFVGGGRTEMEEAEFLIGWERMHRHTFPGPCLRLSPHLLPFPSLPALSWTKVAVGLAVGMREFLSLYPSILIPAPGRSGLRLRLSPEREVRLQAQKILYLFLKYPDIVRGFPNML